jgi:hypothetical protein
VYLQTEDAEEGAKGVDAGCDIQRNQVWSCVRLPFYVVK